MSKIKQGIDAAYAYRFVRLMQKDFKDWGAFKYGIIDDRGSVIKRPQTEAEKDSYTSFHAAVRSMKRMMSTVPGMTGVASLMSAWSVMASRFNINEAETQHIFKELPVLESMVAGNASAPGTSPEHNAENIASGTTTGAVVNKGPSELGKRKRIKVNLSKL
ncbi:hypothetical protein YenMTG1_036 [Yersinia phage vB_YenM_TG1]|uniref:Uncharacterized protein n=1 Tax=Yersinia phage vB_YenM_TG1 TaxID=1589265 RepID=A0A0B5A2F1_9CAUD|nr:hypothetical protein AVV33_gp036 [Yersinia phage vB_YenM_TG1]AJD81845.1 hypothetical protein YenMTG1_036 [Yersinia phage vB_YenM_TG1]